MEKIKSKITTQFNILERSERNSTKRFGKNKDSTVQQNVSYIKQRLGTIRDMKYKESRDND